jgi:hypothetical protein
MFGVSKLSQLYEEEVVAFDGPNEMVAEKAKSRGLVQSINRSPRPNNKSIAHSDCDCCSVQA